jgi:hypothetical protein
MRLSLASFDPGPDGESVTTHLDATHGQRPPLQWSAERSEALAGIASSLRSRNGVRRPAPGRNHMYPSGGELNSLEAYPWRGVRWCPRQSCCKLHCRVPNCSYFPFYVVQGEVRRIARSLFRAERYPILCHCMRFQKRPISRPTCTKRSVLVFLLVAKSQIAPEKGAYLQSRRVVIKKFSRPLAQETKVC